MCSQFLPSFGGSMRMELVVNTLLAASGFVACRGRKVAVRHLTHPVVMHCAKIRCDLFQPRIVLTPMLQRAAATSAKSQWNLD